MAGLAQVAENSALGPAANGAFLASWNRRTGETGLLFVNGVAQPLPDDSTVCLWHAGAMTNRLELATRAAVPRVYPPALVTRSLHCLLDDATWAAIEGDWAAVFWNGRNGELLLLRDRMGIHGLYYAEDGKSVLVSDSVEAILDALASRPNPNLSALVAQMHALPPAAGETCYQGISSLEPGCAVHIGSAGKRLVRYWQVTPQPLLRLASDDEYEQAYRSVLFPVVADYAAGGRVGIALSGGLDSAAVAAGLREALPHDDLTAFTWTAPSLPEADESVPAQAVADHLGLKWAPLRHDERWPLSTPEGLTTERSTPYLDYYHEMWSYTTGLMRQMGITTVFGGIGGDHLFGGVYPYADFFVKGRWGEMVRQMREHRAASSTSLGLPAWTRLTLLSPLAAAHAPSWLLRKPRPVSWLRPQWNAVHHALTATPEHRDLLSPGRQQRLSMLRDRLLPQILERRNAAGAEFGVDFRHPLVDHRLIEFAASLPTEQTMRGGLRKGIVRRALRGYLPGVVLDTRSRLVPTLVGARGLRERETGKVWPLFTDMRSADLGLVDEDEVRRQYNRFVQGETENTLFFYTLTLEAWLRQHF